MRRPPDIAAVSHYLADKGIGMTGILPNRIFSINQRSDFQAVIARLPPPRACPIRATNGESRAFTHKISFARRDSGGDRLWRHDRAGHVRGTAGARDEPNDSSGAAEQIGTAGL
jgi:hypothetical protein